MRQAILVILLIAVPLVAQKAEAPTYKLNPDASKVFVDIDKAEAELRRRFDELEGQRATLLIGAGVPQDSRQCTAGQDGLVVCVKPETAKAK